MYRVDHEMNNGIERITYRPAERQFEPPILFMHGAWHGAWCWQWWQALFAEWGWVSHAFSLPNHGGSEPGRPIRLCTLGYYRDRLRDEVLRCERPPVLVGHSMGGAIVQWYMNDVEHPRAAVLVASMPLRDSPLRYLRMDPTGGVMTLGVLHGGTFVRSPERAKAMFIGDHATLPPEEFQARLDRESMLIPLQLNPIFWRPTGKVDFPLLVMAGGSDAIFTPAEEQRLAAHYGGEYVEFPDTAHNLMMEHNYRASATYLRDWLVGLGFATAHL